MSRSVRGLAMVWVIVAVALAGAALVAQVHLLGVQARSQDRIRRLGRMKTDLEAVERSRNDLVIELDQVTGLSVEGAEPTPDPLKDLLTKKKEQLKIIRPEATFEEVLVRSGERLMISEMSAVRARQDARSAAASAEAAKGFLEEVRRKKEAFLGELTTQRNDLDALRQSQSQLLQTRIDELVAQKEALATNQETSRKKWTDRKAALENDRLKLSNTVENFRRKDAVVRDIVEVQGKILNPDRLAGFAYIDLNEGDGIVPGMKFRVLRPDVAGRRRWIGEVEVKRVFELMSEVSITRVVDSMNPIIDGDQVANPFYRRGTPVSVCFAGKFSVGYSSMEREEWKRRIEALGVKVEDTVSIRTDFLIAGGEAEADPLFQEAAQSSVPVVRAADLQDYLGD